MIQNPIENQTETGGFIEDIILAGGGGVIGNKGI